MFWSKKAKPHRSCWQLLAIDRVFDTMTDGNPRFDGSDWTNTPLKAEDKQPSFRFFLRLGNYPRLMISGLPDITLTDSEAEELNELAAERLLQAEA